MRVRSVGSPEDRVHERAGRGGARGSRCSGRGAGPSDSLSPLPQCKLELVVGSPASCMELELYGSDDKFYSKLDQEDALLGSYPVDDGCRIHVSTPYLAPRTTFIHSFT